jgi:hypothetical protein
MELLGDMGHVESYFSPFGDSFSIGARLVHDLRQTFHRLRNPIGRTRWYSSVILMQDSCTICVERTNALKSF